MRIVNRQQLSIFAPILDKGGVTPELVFLNGGLASIHRTS